MNELILPVFFILFCVVVFLVIDSRRGNARRFIEKLRGGPRSAFWTGALAKLQFVCGIYAACLFVVAAAIHIYSWFPDSAGQHVHSLLWLHIFVLIAFFSGIAFSQFSTEREKNDLLAGASKSVNAAIKISFFYYAVLFLWFFFSHSGYNIHDHNGKHFITHGDQPEREMKPEEYWREEAEGLRSFSALWMLFSLVSAVSLLATRKIRGKDTTTRALKEKL